MMDRDRLAQILAEFSHIRVLVVGDYFLDKYLEIDRNLAETSLETGLEAHQVFGVRCSPGAAGTVVSNLRSLQVQVSCLGAIGDDGEGYELLRGLGRRGADVEHVIRSEDLMTPTYTKPMMHEPDGRIHELSRLDVKNRAPLPPDIEEEAIERLGSLFDRLDGIIVADQMPERNRGLITDRVRAELCKLAAEHPSVPVAVDSRARIGEYRHVILKPNRREACRAIWPNADLEHLERKKAQAAAQGLMERNGGPVFMTAGEEGIWLFEPGCDPQHVPAVPVEGEIDIVGAGDSTMAGVLSSLCCGVFPIQAALIGNLVASVTIQCLGTTGVATPQEVLDAWTVWQEANAF